MRLRGFAVLLTLVVAAVVFGAAAPRASASAQFDTDGTQVSIKIDLRGRAIVRYTKPGGRPKAVIVWGAINALPPDAKSSQVDFSFDYNPAHTRGVRGSCAPYDGPTLPFLVAACKAPDGTYWAVQEWPKPLPDLGFAPWTPALRAQAMDVAHWSGPLPKLEAYPDWTYGGRYHSLFGRFTYAGSPVYGFHTTNVGTPTDSWGRLIYLDAYGGMYGPGWVRENSFVPHNPTGVFCYGLYKADPTKGGYTHPPGDTGIRGPDIGSRYRLIGIGPGVTPDVQSTVDDPGNFDAKSTEDVSFRLKQWRLFSTFIGSDKPCRSGRALSAVNVTAVKSWFSSTPGGDAVTSFTLTTPLYFNVQFDRAPPSSGGRLTAATVKWVNHNSFNYGAAEWKQTDVSVSSNGLVASALFGLKNQNNKRFTGTWNVTMVVNGLTMATGTVDASLKAGTYLALSQPTISGDVRVGGTLTVTPGTWNFAPTNIKYAWVRFPPGGGSGVNLANSQSYTLTVADVGWVVMAEVWVTDPNGRQLIGEAFANGAKPIP